jgi:hypothetical protein
MEENQAGLPGLIEFSDDFILQDSTVASVQFKPSYKG